MAQRNRSGHAGPDAIRKANVTLANTTVNSFTTGTVTFTFADARTTDVVQMNPKAAIPAGLGLVGLRVSASGVVTATWMNATAAAAGTGALNVDVTVQRFST